MNKWAYLRSIKERMQTEKDQVVHQQLRMGSFVILTAVGLHLSRVYTKIQSIKQARYKRFREYMAAFKVCGFFKSNIARKGQTH